MENDDRELDWLKRFKRLKSNSWNAGFFTRSHNKNSRNRRVLKRDNVKKRKKWDHFLADLHDDWKN